MAGNKMFNLFEKSFNKRKKPSWDNCRYYNDKWKKSSHSGKRYRGKTRKWVW